MVILSLGGVTLESFEVPAKLRFGGRQSLAIHRLPGGMRVIDAMGRDDAELSWSGVLSGPEAGNRARTLDAMRVAGSQMPLTWDEFYYSAIIARLALTYTSPWWINYEISCAVVQDEAQSTIAIQPSPAASILADLQAAAGGVDASAAIAAVTRPSSLVLGAPDHAAAVASFAIMQQSLSASLANAEANLYSGDLATVVAAAGSLASATRAWGFLGRAGINLGMAGS